MRLTSIFNLTREVMGLKIQRVNRFKNSEDYLDNLIANWPLKSDFNDKSGNGFNLVPHNNPYLTSNGAYINNSYLTFSRNVLRNRQLPVTFNFTIKSNDTSENGAYNWCQSTIIGFATSGNSSNDFGIELKNGYLHIFSGFAEESYYTTNYYISDGNQHKVDIVFSKTYYKIYIDNIFKEQHNHNSVDGFSNQTEIDSDNMSIGSIYLYQTNQYMSGSYLLDTYLRNFRIYSKELTSDEINKIPL